MQILLAECSVDYAGRLSAHLPLAKRVIIIKADGSVLIHSDGGSYKPLNWMSPPCKISEVMPEQLEQEQGVTQILKVCSTKTPDTLLLKIHHLYQQEDWDLGIDPGLVKDGVEAHLQELLAQQVKEIFGADWKLVRREYPTPIGPVDLMLTDPNGEHVAVEVKRRGEIDGVEQLTRYLELLGRDPLLAPLRGVFAAQEIKPQARTLAEDRGIQCLILDYDAMRGVDDIESRLF